MSPTAESPPSPAEPARPSFAGSGTASLAWRATLVLCGLAALLFILGIVLAWLATPSRGFDDSASWTAVALFAFGWFTGVVALGAWAVAVGLAAFGRGALPFPVLALGAAAFVLAAILCVLSLSATGAPLLVVFALAACILGLVASFAAWRRMGPTASSP